MSDNQRRNTLIVFLLFVVGAVAVPLYRDWYAGVLIKSGARQVEAELREVAAFSEAMGMENYLRYLEIVCANDTRKCR